MKKLLSECLWGPRWDGPKAWFLRAATRAGGGQYVCLSNKTPVCQGLSTALICEHAILTSYLWEYDGITSLAVDPGRAIV